MAAFHVLSGYQMQCMASTLCRYAVPGFATVRSPQVDCLAVILVLVGWAVRVRGHYSVW